MSIKAIIDKILRWREQRRDRRRFMKLIKAGLKSKQFVIIEPSIMLTPEGRRLIRTGEYFQYEEIEKTNERSEK